jgi:hypothetical protein
MDWTAAKITLKVGDPPLMVELFTGWDCIALTGAQNGSLDYYASRIDTVETTPSIAHGLCDTDGHPLF